MQNELPSPPTEISAEHLQSMKAMWTKNKAITPDRIRKHYSLLDNDNPIYSVDVVERAIASFELGRMRPTAERRAATAALQALQPTPIVSVGHQAAPDSSSRHQLAATVAVEHPDLGRTMLRLPHSCTLAQFKTLAAECFDLDPDHRLQVSLRTDELDHLVFVSTTEVLNEMLEQYGCTCLFQLRSTRTGSSGPISPGGTQDSRRVDPLRQEASTSSDLVSSGKSTTAQWQHSLKVSQSIKTRVCDSLAAEGGVVGSSHVTTSIGELFRLLRVSRLLLDTWDDLLAEHRVFEHGIEERQLLEWFITAVMQKFHPVLNQLWLQEASDPAFRNQRRAAVFSTAEAFVLQVYLTVRPGTTGFQIHVLPAMLQDLERRISTFATRRLVCSELRHIWATTQFLQTHLCPGESCVDQPIKQFLENALSLDMRERLCMVLKENHSAELPPYLRQQLDFAPIHAYSVESILARWAAFDSLQARPLAMDWASPLRAPGPPTERRGPQRLDSLGRPSVLPAAGPPSPAAAAPLDQTWSSDSFTVVVNREPITLRKHLGSWADLTDREQELSKFVKAMYNFSGACNLCHKQGHRARGCPTHIQLDPQTGVDMNPKSFFYKLKPPLVALEAARPVPSGSNTGVRLVNLERVKFPHVYEGASGRPEPCFARWPGAEFAGRPPSPGDRARAAPTGTTTGPGTAGRRCPRRSGS